jgi:hypothetical protein
VGLGWDHRTALFTEEIELVGWVATKNLRIATHPFFLAMFFCSGRIDNQKKKLNHVADPEQNLTQKTGWYL